MDGWFGPKNEIISLDVPIPPILHSCSPNLVLALPVFSSNYEHTRERMNA
jgi:hypothetical protein